MTSLRVTFGGVDRDGLRAQLDRASVSMNAAALTLFDDARFITAPHGSTIAVEVRAVAELGLPHGGTFAELIDAAAKAGLTPCPLELGAHLRLQLIDQPEGARGQPATMHRAPPGSITVASLPLDDDDDTPKGFYLRRIEGALWLRGYRAGMDHRWSPDDVFAFARGDTLR